MLKVASHITGAKMDFFISGAGTTVSHLENDKNRFKPHTVHNDKFKMDQRSQGKNMRPASTRSKHSKRFSNCDLKSKCTKRKNSYM